jgi:hypothetical protein
MLPPTMEVLMRPPPPIPENSILELMEFRNMNAAQKCLVLIVNEIMDALENKLVRPAHKTKCCGVMASAK